MDYRYDILGTIYETREEAHAAVMALNADMDSDTVNEVLDKMEEQLRNLAGVKFRASFGNVEYHDEQEFRQALQEQGIPADTINTLVSMAQQ